MRLELRLEHPMGGIAAEDAGDEAHGGRVSVGRDGNRGARNRPRAGERRVSDRGSKRYFDPGEKEGLSRRRRWR